MQSSQQLDDYSAQRILKYVLKVQYGPYLNGICAGYAQVGLWYFLLGKLTAFDALILLIYNVINPIAPPTSDLINEIKERRTLFNDAQTEKVLKCIYAYQEPQIFPELFNQAYLSQSHVTELNAALRLSLTSEDIIDDINAYAKFFTQKQIQHFLNIITNTVKKPIAFTLSYQSHRITIGYEPDSEMYAYIDANHAPSKPFSQAALAKKFKTIFTHKKLFKIAFYLHVFATHVNANNIRQALNKLSKTSRFKKLIQINNDDKELRYKGNSLLHIVTRKGNESLTESYSKIFDPNEPNARLKTPLHNACKYNFTQVTATLLRRKVDANPIHCRGKSPLHYAAKRGNLESTRLLLAKGCDPHQENIIEGELIKAASPLCLAVKNNKIQILEICYQQNINLFKSNSQHKTLLDYATELKREQIVNYLTSLQNSAPIRFFARYPRIKASKTNQRKRSSQTLKIHHPATQQKRQKSANS